jgi:hypothetical protein
MPSCIFTYFLLPFLWSICRCPAFFIKTENGSLFLHNNLDPAVLLQALSKKWGSGNGNTVSSVPHIYQFFSYMF